MRCDECVIQTIWFISAATAVVEKILDAQEVVDFDTSMRKLRVIVAQLPKDKFASGEQEITEKQW